ncbi:MAG: ABC transporter permease [Bacteroidia bacterium]|nr:ABC transporter permease [Bacteroidia bacterium]
MFKSSLKLIFRNWWRNKTFTLISILSLTVGIACTALLISFVSYEYGIEKDNPNRDKLVWVMQDMPSNPGKKVAYMQKGIPEQLKEKYPEVEDFLQLNSFDIKYIEVDNQRFDPIEIINVDASFPAFFPFQLLYGSWNAFSNPQSMIISENQAKKLFGNENAIGKQITVCERGLDSEVRKVYTVGAVAKTRAQSAITFDGLVCNPEGNWGGPTLFKMSENANLAQLEEKVKKDQISTLADGQYYFFTFDQAISSTYNQQELSHWHYRKDNLLIVGLISAILVFLIAIFNYVNMSFSRVLQQVKTLHTQKLMGAKPKDVRMQIFLDTFLTVFISFILAILMMHDLLPVFNQVVSVDFSSQFFYSKDFFPILILFVILLTIIPALIMSQKISRLSGNEYRLFFVTRKNRWIGSLVTVQLIIAIALIIATITANRQVNLTQKIGTHYKNLIVIGNHMNEVNLINFDEKIRLIPGVENVSKGNLTLMNDWIIYGTLKKENGEEFQTTVIRQAGDEELLNVLRLNQIAGENWKTMPEKYPNSVFVNKTFADLVEKSPQSLVGEPLIKYFGADYASSVISGVVDDFYFHSLEEKAVPIIIERINALQQEYYTMLVKFEANKKPKTIQTIKSAWEQNFPHVYFTYTDVYEGFLKRNNNIFEMSRLLRMYSLISILLTCFGLFGITFNAVKQRTKEIGIRKINGAKTPQLLWLLMKPMFVWITIGFVIAVPLVWWLIERWLQQFVYRVDVSVFSFVLAFLAVSAITFLTVGWHVWRTAQSNPVKSLKSE